MRFPCLEFTNVELGREHQDLLRVSMPRAVLSVSRAVQGAILLSLDWLSVADEQFQDGFPEGVWRG